MLTLAAFAGSAIPAVRPAWRHAEPTAPAALAAALAEPDTVIVLVIGAGPEADQAEARCQGLAEDPGFEAVRVVRVRHHRELTEAQRTRWLHGRPQLSVVLGPDRHRALPLRRPDAVDLFVAVAALA